MGNIEDMMSAKEQGADATQNRWLTIPRTLCFVTNGDDVLLMKRAPTRRVFPNRYNGVGGHIERDETPEAGAIREIIEETGLSIDEIRLCGIHNIDAGADTGILLFVFVAKTSQRDFMSDESEGTLHWIRKDEVLSLDLVEDLPQILPYVLAMSAQSPPYFAHVSYDNQDKIQIRLSQP
jgi:8-oxo-dGTP diphosphatase